MNLQELKELIVLSLDAKPCSISELNKRDFLKNISNSGAEQLVYILEKDGVVYEKGEKWYAYKNSKFLKNINS